MDENFEYFLEKFGSVICRQVVPELALEKYKGVLPDQLLHYWREIGWCGLANGLFWLVDPNEWHVPMETMLADASLLERDIYHVIARNAFGDLWLWGQKTGGSLRIKASDGMVFPQMPASDFGTRGINFELQLFFAVKSPGDVDLIADDEKPLFQRAYEKLGPLEAHQVYGFVPLPALGGATELNYLQKLEAATYMDLVAQSTVMRVMPDYTAIAAGRAS